MKDHWISGSDVNQFGQVFLSFTYVNHALGVITKDAKELVNMEVNRRRLNAVTTEGIDDDSTLLESLFD
jgi:hypothetical protein